MYNVIPTFQAGQVLEFTQFFFVLIKATQAHHQKKTTKHAAKVFCKHVMQINYTCKYRMHRSLLILPRYK